MREMSNEKRAVSTLRRSLLTVLFSFLVCSPAWCECGFRPALNNIPGNAATATLATAATIANGVAALSVGTAGIAVGAVTLDKTTGVRSSILVAYVNCSLSYMSTCYVSPGATITSTQSVEVAMRAPRSGTLANLYVQARVGPQSNCTYTCTVRVGGQNSALIATMANPTTAANDAAHTVAVNAGDLISFALTSTVGQGGVTDVTISVELQ